MTRNDISTLRIGKSATRFDSFYNIITSRRERERERERERKREEAYVCDLG